MSKRVLFVLTSHAEKGNTGEKTGAYLPEVAHPYAELTKAGVTVDFVTPKGGRPPFDGVDLKDPVNKAFMEDAAIQARLERTPTPDAVDAASYDAIFFAGGHGAVWDFPDDERLQKLAASIYERGGIVSAVCHGPCGLVNVKLSDGTYLVAGKEVAAFTDDEERAVKLDKVVPFLLATTLVERGAKHRPAPNWQAQIVVDGRLITGQNPASATGVGRALAEALSGK
jgi:putative intracellular protease/amidase